MKKLTCFLFLLLAVTMAAAQQNNDGDKVISVPQKYVSPEGLGHQVTNDANSDHWINMGREIGAATREGLNAVVDTADRFGRTRVGTFVMVMVAWRIMGEQVFRVVLGIPIMIAAFFVWLYVAKRMVFGYRVLAKKEGPWWSRIRTYEDHKPYDFDSGDARTVCGVFLTIGLIAIFAVMLPIIFV